MTKRGLYYRLKLALWHFYTDEVWLTWEAKKPQDMTFKQSQAEERDQLIIQMDKRSRGMLLEYIKLKAKSQIRENTKFLNPDETLINRARLFQVIEMKQDIERIIEQEKKDQEKLKKEAMKAK